MENECVSIIIPARNEIHLNQTIESILSAAEGDIEIIPILDGYWPDLRIPYDSRIKVIHNVEAKGQRASVNEGARVARGKYIMKLDAHSMVDEGFDVKLKADCEYDWTVIPRMYNLDAEKWEPKWNKKTDFMYIRSPDIKDRPFRVYYLNDVKTAREYPEEYKAFKKAPWRQGDICDVMTGQGACFFMHKARYWELGGLDEAHGSWGQMGAEVALKAWLSGGSLKVNKKTWFAHMFRTKAGEIPYKMSGKDQQRARDYSINFWLNEEWPLQKRSLSSLVDKFGPVPTWEPSPSTGDPDATPSVSSPSDLTVLYYTANIIADEMQNKVIESLKDSLNGNRIISISHKPMLQFKENICVGDDERSLQQIYRQVLIGAKRATTKYVVLCEDDCLYTPEHFDHRPSEGVGFAYNLNRWCLHTRDNLFSYRRRPVLSQCIANREILIKNLEERFALEEIPDKYCGEMGIYEKQLGMNEYHVEEFETEKPNIVICHDKGIQGIKYHGKDAEPCTNLAPWGEASKIIEAIQERKKEMRKPAPRRQHSYIGSHIFEMQDLIDFRMDFADRRKIESAKRFLRVFPPFIERVAKGETFSDEQLEATEYFDYQVSKLNPADRDPLTNKGRRHARNLLKREIKIFFDIKENGLKAPLDMWREGPDKFVLHRGGRRVEMLRILGYKTVPVRIFKSKEVFRHHNPPIISELGSLDGEESIHQLGMRQFMKLRDKATDKYWVHDYLRLYDRYIGDLRKKKLKILEIGVLRGASLLLWKEAFPKSSIYGIDKNWAQSRPFLEGQERIEVFQGRQEDREFLKEKVIPSGPFDIIIDDGGHRPGQQQPSFEILWKNLNPGGWYIIEDLFGNYRKDFQRDGKRAGVGSTMEYLKMKIDEAQQGFEIKSMSFYYNICFIEKG